MGLWIDLTNTNRYYNPSVVTITGCQYKKLKLEGHGLLPYPVSVQSFIRLVDEFIKKHPEQIIGVHCTHGFNRTGYMIVSYLVERLKYSIHDALSLFSEARSPGIYREQYVTGLIKNYGGDLKLVSSIVKQPNWKERAKVVSKSRPHEAKTNSLERPRRHTK